MIYPDANYGSRPFNFTSTARASADLKGSTFQLLYLLLRVVGLGAGFEEGARVFFEASPDFFCGRLDLDGGVVASPLVLAILAVAVVEETAADAVTRETTAATDGMLWSSSPYFSYSWWFARQFQRCTSLPVLQPSGDKSTVPCVLSSHRISWDCRRI